MQNAIQNFFKNNNKIFAFCDAIVIRMEDIPDKAFSNCMIGDGLALQHSATTIYAPCTGHITLIAPTKHAFVITSDNGAEILVHIGLHTKKENEVYFTHHMKIGDYVQQDTLLTTIHEDYVKQSNNKIITSIFILNTNEHPVKSFTTANLIKRGKPLFTFK